MINYGTGLVTELMKKNYANDDGELERMHTPVKKSLS